MNEVAVEKTMTTKELADALGVTPRTIQLTVEKLDLAKSISQVKIRGQNSYVFDEAQATAIKIELQNHSKVASNGFNTLDISSDLEMLIVQQKLNAYQNQRIAELTEKLYSAENTVNRLSFGDRKTFTATEIAKELNLSSAEKLNTWLAGKRFQYKSNGTWVCYSEFADKGYTEIKKEILANGKIKYNRHFTNKGRDYILLMWEKENTAEKSSADSNK